MVFFDVACDDVLDQTKVRLLKREQLVLVLLKVLVGDPVGEQPRSSGYGQILLLLKLV